MLAGLQENPPVGLGTTFAGESVPGLRNDDGASCTHCDLKQAMTLSNNVVFNSLAKQVGAQAVADAARSAGIATPLDQPDERIALGNKEITAVDLASAYATIAAGGVWHQPHLVASVVTTDGRVLYQSPTDGERRFSDRVARNVTEAMLDVAPHDDLALPGGRPVAAKTGTVQSHVAGQNNDAWMAGFTPSVVAAVWLGTDRNEPIRTASGRPISGKDLPGDGLARLHDRRHRGPSRAGLRPVPPHRLAAFGPAARRRSAQAAGHRDRRPLRPARSRRPARRSNPRRRRRSRRNRPATSPRPARCRRPAA